MSSIKLTADSGGGTVELKAPASTGSNANKQFILPQNDGTANQALVTDASGNLSFAAKGKVLKVQQTTMPLLATYTAASTTYQEVTQDPFVVTGTNTNLLIMLEINGYMSHNNADRNFRLSYKVGSGSYTNINFNPNGTVSENMFGDIRGDSYNHEVNITTHFLIDGTWSAGSTITVKLETVGEGTFNLNGAPATSDVRFGNGLSKFVFTEYSD
tara:strand:- start:445 stop:1086 length:642 start_codon:yes stop_codon:yes gene_type:complete